MTRIPFFTPFITGKETAYVQEAIGSGHWSGDGPFSKKCVEVLEKLTGTRVFLTPSATAALELALMSLNLNAGEEVILPSYTFVSTANAVVQMGLVPVFIDVRRDTLNIDEGLIEAAISKKTRAIMVVHYAGISAEMDSINAIAKKHRLAVIEDAAQGVNASYKGKALGALGDLGAYSFHQTKNYSCGEGGAIIVGNEKYMESADIHRQKGTNRSKFLQGRVDKYSWVDRGSNYLLSNILAAFLLAQLEGIKAITELRKHIFERYYGGLQPLSNGRFHLPVIPEGCQTNYHCFFICLESETVRRELMAWLLEKGVETTTHFVPLHSSLAGQRYGVVRSKMDVTDAAGFGLVRFPLYPQMSTKDVDYVVDCVRRFFDN